jgi:hypothetical protein
MTSTRGRTVIDGHAVRLEYAAPPPYVDLSPIHVLLPHTPVEHITRDKVVDALSVFGEVLSVLLFHLDHHLTARVRFAGEDCARAKTSLSARYPDLTMAWDEGLYPHSRPFNTVHDEAHSIFVGGLYPILYSVDGLRQLFSAFGEIDLLHVFSGRAKPFAFIRYTSPTSATNAVAQAGSESRGRVSRFQRNEKTSIGCSLQGAP